MHLHVLNRTKMSKFEQSKKSNLGLLLRILVLVVEQNNVSVFFDQ